MIAIDKADTVEKDFRWAQADIDRIAKDFGQGSAPNLMSAPAPFSKIDLSKLDK
jgi:hypothetical protein